MLKKTSRKLLTASIGVASVTLSGCPLTTGNLMPPTPRCPDGGVVVYSSSMCADACEPGTTPSYNADFESDFCYPVEDAGDADAGDAAIDDAAIDDADIADADEAG